MRRKGHTDTLSNMSWCKQCHTELWGGLLKTAPSESTDSSFGHVQCLQHQDLLLQARLNLHNACKHRLSKHAPHQWAAGCLSCVTPNGKWQTSQVLAGMIRQEVGVPMPQFASLGAILWLQGNIISVGQKAVIKPQQVRLHCCFSKFAAVDH